MINKIIFLAIVAFSNNFANAIDDYNDNEYFFNEQYICEKYINNLCELPGTFWVQNNIQTKDNPIPITRAYIFLRDNMVLIVETVFNRLSYDFDNMLYFQGTYHIIKIIALKNYGIQDGKIIFDLGSLQGILKDGFLYIGSNNSFDKFIL